MLRPEWPVPARVAAATTTRRGGVSIAPYATLNLAHHVGDDPAAVAENRRRLQVALELPAEPLWLSQVHSCSAVDAATSAPLCEADAAYTDRPGVVCAVLTADCLPILLADRDGTEVAAVHAGWRGLVNGVIEQTVARMASPAERLYAWLGPAIGPQNFEVGEEVRAAFVAHDCQAVESFRLAARSDHWYADIYQLARQRLAAIGVGGVYGGGLCTVNDAERFYSYRRDGVTGRMASLIWIRPAQYAATLPN